MSATERDQIRQAGDQVLRLATSAEPSNRTPEYDAEQRSAAASALYTVGTSFLCDLNRLADAAERMAIAAGVTAGVLTPDQAAEEWKRLS